MSEGKSNRWLLVVILVGSVALIGFAMRGARSAARASDARFRSEIETLVSVVDAQNRRLSEIEQALDQRRIASMDATTHENGLISQRTSDQQIARLAELIATTSVLQSNTLMVVERLTENFPQTAPARLTLDQRRAAYDSLRRDAEHEFAELDQMKQSTADLMFELQVPDDVATMEAARALDTPSLSRYWPYFESKRRRERLQDFADAIEMKMVQEKMNLGLEEARETSGR